MPQSLESQIARLVTAYTLEYSVGLAPPQILTLPIAPQSTSFEEPARAEVQQTLTRQYAEEWGGGIKTIRLSGNTGFSTKQVGNEQIDGYQGFMRLRKLMRDYLDQAYQNATSYDLISGAQQQLILHMWEEDEHWIVIPTGPDALRSDRSAERPLLFDFSLSFSCLQKATVDASAKQEHDLLVPQETADLLNAIATYKGIIDSLTPQWIISGSNTVLGFAKTASDKMAQVQAYYQAIGPGVTDSKLGMLALGAANSVKDLREQFVALAADPATADSALQGGWATAIAYSFNLMQTWCVLTCLYRNMQNSLGFYQNPYLTSWQLWQQQDARC